MAYYLGVDIRDGCIHFLYGKGTRRQLGILDEGRLFLDQGIICKGMIEEELQLGELLRRFIEGKRWQPHVTGVLIPVQCVMRREITMPTFMETHLEAYVASYGDSWLAEQLEEYVFTAHRLEGGKKDTREVDKCDEQCKSRRGRKRGLQVESRRYCLVGSPKDVILRPYHLLGRLKWNPYYISTPLDVGQYVKGEVEAWKHQVRVLEEEDLWQIGIYEGAVCVLASAIRKEAREHLLLEMHKLIQFYHLKYPSIILEGCSILWHKEREASVESLIEESFELPVVSLCDKRALHGLMNRLHTGYLKGGVS